MNNKQRVINGILGAIVGDAMGVPYEFKDRTEIKSILKGEMVSDERRGLPKGTWSDDSSMILCTVESLNTHGTNMKAMGNTFIKWYDKNHWTPHGRVFDIGSTTRNAMDNIKLGFYINGAEEMDKGNGSLMRILPLACYLHDKDASEIKETIENCSALTHSTKECKIACVWYSLIVTSLMNTRTLNMSTVLFIAEKAIMSLYSREELRPFSRILSDEVLYLTPDELNGSGYVVHSLEVIINCLFNSINFRDAILRAISIGFDTDTNASLVGGLVGLRHEISQDLIDDLVRKEDILELLEKINWI